MDFLCDENKFKVSSSENLKNSMKIFFEKKRSQFHNKKVCVIVPDHTREFHAKRILNPLAEQLRPLSQDVVFIISLGLHKRLRKSELDDFLGERFLKSNKVIQHSLENVRSLGKINGIPATLNRKLFDYDLFMTVGVVEPHLYAGFSGGIKGIGIGLAGHKTILHTHSVKYLSQKDVRVSNTTTNPFQKYLWDLMKHMNKPIYSLNIINNLNKKIAFFSLGEARKSFLETVKQAKKFYSYKITRKYDVLFVGCDFPKQNSLYQASRLFNSVLDHKPLVRKGGVIIVIADIMGIRKSQAELNFEMLLKQKSLLRSYSFSNPGEHRASKIIQASQMAHLCLVTPNLPRGRSSNIHYFKDYREALSWAKEKLGKDLKIGIIPLGFSFIPSS